MESIIFMNTSFIINSIMKTKIKNYQENFVTLNELILVKGALQEKFKQKNLRVQIADKISNLFRFDNNVYIMQEGLTIEEIEKKYQDYCFTNEIFKILWDDDYIYETLENAKKDGHFIPKSLDDILNKIIKNPKKFYEQVAQELSLEEYEYIKSKLDYKSCKNCIYDCMSSKECSKWKNDELIGRSKILSKN